MKRSNSLEKILQLYCIIFVYAGELVMRQVQWSSKDYRPSSTFACVAKH